jgi:transcription initiation factor TFIIB
MEQNQVAHQEQSDEETNDETETEETEQTECEECGGTLRENEQQGEIVCEDCGLVAEDEAIDHGPEWRAFDAGERDEKSRVGAPTTNMMHDKGLSTNIGWQDKDANGTPLSSSQRKKMHRLRKWDERFRTQNSQDRNLKQALSEITRMASALGLIDQAEETAGVLYRRCQEEDLIRGRSIEGMATACLYAAARQCNTPRTLEEVYPVSRVYNDSKDDDGDNSNEIDRSYRYIAKELGLKMQPVDPRQYLNRFINELSVDQKQAVRATAEEFLDAAEKANIHSGKSPTGLAASAIYAAGLVHGEALTQREIADVTDITEVTVRNRYQEMMEAHEDIPVE